MNRCEVKECYTMDLGFKTAEWDAATGWKGKECKGKEIVVVSTSRFSSSRIAC